MEMIALFISGSEIFIILLVVLLLFGANKLPEIARGLGKGYNEFKKATQDIRSEFDEHTRDFKKEVNDFKQNIAEDVNFTDEKTENKEEEKKQDTNNLDETQSRDSEDDYPADKKDQ